MSHARCKLQNPGTSSTAYQPHWFEILISTLFDLALQSPSTHAVLHPRFIGYASSPLLFPDLWGRDVFRAWGAGRSKSLLERPLNGLMSQSHGNTSKSLIFLCLLGAERNSRRGPIVRGLPPSSTCTPHTCPTRAPSRRRFFSSSLAPRPLRLRLRHPHEHPSGVSLVYFPAGTPLHSLLVLG